MKTVTKREAVPLHLLERKRVAAYTRTSCGKEAMLESLSAQVSYYSDMIQKNPAWIFAGVYTDEAVTGTKDKRPEFQRLLADCRAGKIDMVITKSITRFARNTVTTLETVRELKLLGVDVYFERENIHSMSGEGELMLTILASYAQEESRSVSENCKWRVRRDFREGRVGGMTMLGYRLEKGRLVIVPEEAEVVRSIFTDYLSGMGISALSKKYRTLGVNLTCTGIRGLLRNEKVAGDMRLQKSFVSDHLTKRKIMNTGQLPQYYVRDSHKAIIPREQFDAVQAEIARRAAFHQPNPQAPKTYPLTGLVKCGVCGAGYRRKHAAAGTKYEKIVWICDTFNEMGRTACGNQQIPETILLSKTQEAGGFDGLAQIIATGPGALSFLYMDGHAADLMWQNPSRRESWTPEMRETARQKTLQQRRQRD